MPSRELLEILPGRQAIRAAAGGELDPLRDIPDLSVGREYQMLLIRTGRAAVVDITFKTSAARHHAYYYGISEKLVGRTELVSISDNNLIIDFQVEDDSPRSFALVQRFADSLRRVLGDDVKEVNVRINTLDIDDVEVTLKGERARLRAL